jgi:hypothetical protein
MEIAKNPNGRPTKYKREFEELAYNYALLGVTDKELSVFFEVNVDTIHEWKKKHKKFSDALKKGKEVADAKVAQSLYHRALGYDHAEDKIMQFAGDPIIIPTIKYYPPDTTACIFWLKNRQKDKWREKQEVDIKDSADLFKHFVNGVLGSQDDD